MTPARALRALLLSVAVACALPVPAAYACSCAVAPGHDAPLEGTVFYGEILSRTVDGQRAVYDVAVERVYAGETGRRAQVHTSAHGASCGLEIPGSGHAVFYTTKEGGRLSSHLCTGTRSADGPPTGLGEGRPPSVGSPLSEAAPPAGPAGPGGPGDGGSNALPVAAAFVAVAACAALVLVSRRGRPTTLPGPAA